MTRQFECDNPLDELRRRVEAIRAVHLPELPPFCSGAVGYAGYDTVRYFERLPNAPPDDRHVPDMAFAFYDQMVVFDNVSQDDRRGGDGPAGPARRHGGRRPTTMPGGASIAWSSSLPCAAGATCGRSTFAPAAKCSSTTARISPRPQFEAAVRKCVEYIRAGDIFQVVLSQRLEVPLTPHPFEIYRTLRVVNPSPFMFYVRTPSVTLVGSSPEVMVRVVDGQVTVRPLAGTRRRGATEEEDRRLAEELLADPKERAEHVMLVDLGRNDVGRVCRYRSVESSDVMTIERYSHVMHITSNVSGELAAGQDGLRRPAGLLARRHGVRCPEGPRHGDHRRIGAAPPRALCRRGRLRRFQRQHGHLHRPADDGHAGRQGLRAGRRRHRGRQRAGERMAGDAQQGPRAAEGDRVGPRAGVLRSGASRSSRRFVVDPSPRAITESATY